MAFLQVILSQEEIPLLLEYILLMHVSFATFYSNYRRWIFWTSRSYFVIWIVFLWLLMRAGDATKCAKPNEVHKVRQQIAENIEKWLKYDDTIVTLWCLEKSILLESQDVHMLWWCRWLVSNHFCKYNLYFVSQFVQWYFWNLSFLFLVASYLHSNPTDDILQRLYFIIANAGMYIVPTWDSWGLNQCKN